MAEIQGIDVERVTGWIREHVPELDEPLAFELVAAGRSNLTFKVTDASERRWVLRRPPTGHVLASAHDMGREHRIISALRDTDVPVPNAVGYCQDPAVNGAPFYVMDFVDGVIVRDARGAGTLSEPAKRRIASALVETLVRLHAIDPSAVGLGDLGRTEGYIARQLKRWMTQIEQGSDRDLPRIREVHGRLEAAMPVQQGAGIVHGDYRLDNCIIDPETGDLAAVLDWELCTLGDVLADVGMLLMYVGYRPGSSAGPAPLGADGGLIGGQQVIELYRKLSDRDLGELPYYVAFANWRLACILEGVRVRFERGAMGGKDIGPELAAYAQRVDGLVELASSLLDQLPR